MDILTIAKIFLLNEKGELLLVQRGGHDTNRPNEWDLPGGRVELDEEPSNTAIRKLQEETGIAIEWLQLVYATTNFYGEKEEAEHVIRLHYRAEVPQGEVELTFEHKEYEWFPLDKARTALTHPVHSAVLKDLATKGYISGEV